MDVIIEISRFQEENDDEHEICHAFEAVTSEPQETTSEKKN